MTEKYLMFSLEDEKIKKISEILGSSSAKKILDFLAEQEEMSESDIARELEMPLNTLEYNLKKLVETGLVERGSRWWSVKGKRIEMYKIARKHIVISHKSKPSYSKLKSILPAIAATGILAFILKTFMGSESRQIMNDAVSESAPAVLKATESFADVASSAPLPIWAWFLMGAGIALAIMVLLNWRKL